MSTFLEQPFVYRGQGLKPFVVRTFTASIHKEDDLYVALCPEAGTASQGYSVESATVNLKEATELYLEMFPLPEAGPPIFALFEATYAAEDTDQSELASLDPCM
jgi:predicted RNase H-like HicB family nuclease